MEDRLKNRNIRRKRRMQRVRKKLRGNAERPRLSVFRSNKHIGAQLIDDENHVTLFGVGSLSKEFKGTENGKKSKSAARMLGKRIAEEAKKKKIGHVIFDRGQYKYHGVIAELADAAREAGLKF